MADRKYPIIFDFQDNDAVNRMNQVAEAVKNIKRESDESKKAQSDMFKEAAKGANDQAAAEMKLAAETQNANETTERQNVLLSELGKQLRSRLNEVKIFGVGLADMLSKLKNIRGGLKGVVTDLKNMRSQSTATTLALSGNAKAATTFTRALGFMKAALASLGIGIILIALGGLIKLIQQSEKITAKLSDVMAGLGATIKGVGGFIQQLGKTMLNLITLDFKGAMESSAEATRIFKDEIVGAYKEAANYNQVLRETQKIMEGVERSTGLFAKRFVELDEVINSSTSSYDEKMAAINEKQSIQISALDRMISQQNKLIDAATTQEQREEAILKLRELEAQRLSVNLGVQSQVHKIHENIRKEQERITREAEKEAREREKIRQSMIDALNSLEEKYSKLNAKTLSPLAKINEEESIAIKELENRLNELSDLYLKHDGDHTKLIQAGDMARQAIHDYYAKQRESLHSKLLDNIRKAEEKAYGGRIDDLKEFSAEVEAEIREMMDLETYIPETGWERLEERFQKFIRNLFKIKPEDLKEFQRSVNALLVNMLQSWATFNDARIKQNEELLDNLREQKNEIRESLEQEIEDAAAGYRNDVENSKKRYEEIIAEEKKASQERIKLQKQQLIVQETISLAMTILNLAEAASTLAKTSAVLGPIAGPIAFAISIGAILATFTKIKSQIDSIKLFTGGDLSTVMSPTTRDHGLVNRTQGKNDKYTNGHRIEGSNIVVGGQEYINNAETSLRYNEFLDRLNSGKLDHLDLNAIGRDVKKQYPVFDPHSQVLTQIRKSTYTASSTLTKQDMREVVKELFPEMFENLGAKIDNRKEITYKPDGTRVEYTQRRRTEIK